mgnify:CR=1 FL=1
MGYGEHLHRFLKGKTGLLATRKNKWGKLVFELLEQIADRKYTDGKIRGKGVQDLLKAFNSFESHDLWCLDEGDSGEGFGVQFVIVWDGGMLADPQVVTKPKVPVTSVSVIQDQEEADEMAMIQELEQRQLVEIEREED